MEEKKLDDLMKDLQTYSVQVAQEKKLAQIEASRVPFVFPWKYVIIATAVGVWYFWKPIKFVGNKVAEQHQIQELLKALDQSEPAPNTATNTALQAKQEALNGKESGPNLAASEPGVVARKVASDNGYVKIQGKYYKKSADNVYNINGQRVFFIDNRKREDEKPQ